MLNALLKQAGLVPEKATDSISLSSDRPGAAKAALRSNPKPASDDKSAHRIIVSVTSYHKRFSALVQTLATLDSQKQDEDYEVHVHLSEEDVGKNIEYQEEFDKIEQQAQHVLFFYHRDNLLSYKKLFYSLKSFPDATIITADDDVLYPHDWLDGLLKKHKQHPDCIICYRGHYLEINKGKFKRYANIMFKRRTCTEPSLWLLPTGVSGVLYPPGSLDPTIALDRSAFMQMAPKSDDFWFKLASLSKKTKCVRVHQHNQRFPPVPFTQISALAWSNAAFGVNDQVLQNISERYHDIFAVFAAR